ncbi:MAG: acylphosphatase [Bacteroidia bacterium]|nr:acylphosphatase [Bacteroidia bacterium]
MDKVHYNILVKGKVQGVWFRKYTKDQAVNLGIRGYVENDDNGNVYVEAEGTTDAIDSFIETLKKGSPLSKVLEVLYDIDSSKGFKEFKIIR